MQVSFTTKQLTNEIIAGILNQSYITSEILKRNNESTYVWSHYGGREFGIEATPDGIEMQTYQFYPSDIDRESLLKVANYMDWLIVDSQYIEEAENGDHVMRFHYQHWIPEDESITASYIVKLTRSFARQMERIDHNWPNILSAAIEAK